MGTIPSECFGPRQLYWPDPLIPQSCLRLEQSPGEPHPVPALTPLPQPSSPPAKGAGDTRHLLDLLHSIHFQQPSTLLPSLLLTFHLPLGPLIGVGENKNQRSEQWFVGLS